MGTHEVTIVYGASPQSIFDEYVELDGGGSRPVVSEKRFPLCFVTFVLGKELGKVETNVFGKSSAPVDHFFVEIKHEGFLPQRHFSRHVFRLVFLLFSRGLPIVHAVKEIEQECIGIKRRPRQA